MPEITFNQKLIQSSYAIATDSLDDTAPYSGDGDICLYFNNNFGWGSFKDKDVYDNELLLSQAFDVATNYADTKKRGFKPFPIFVETVISTVNSESLEAHILQNRRARAVAKLDHDDMIALGLIGEGK